MIVIPESVDRGMESGRGYGAMPVAIAIGRGFLSIVILFVIVLLLPLIIIIAPILLIYRFTLVILIRHFEGRHVTIMSPDDVIWLQDSPTNPAIINALMLFAGTPDIHLIRRLFIERLVEVLDPNNNRLVLFPKFTKYASYSMNVCVWREEKDFDIAEHVYMHDRPLPQGQTDRERLVSEFCSQPLPEKKSAWQAIVLESSADSTPESERMFLVVFRVHHSLADGIALTKMLIDNLVDTCAGGCSLPSRFGSTRQALGIMNTVFNGPLLLASRFVMRADKNSLHGPPLTGVKHTAWSEPVTLALIRRITSLTSSTINDVLVSCLAGAFGAYFEASGRMPPSDDLRAYMPVDTRPRSRQQVAMVNHFTLVFLKLPIAYDDPLETLRVTKRRMDDMKASPEAILNAITVTYSMSVLPYMISKKLFDWLAKKCTMVLSNVPGPQQKLSLGGYPLENIIFWPPQKNDIGLGISIFSYNGNVQVGVISDGGILDTPRVIVEEFQQKLKQLARRLHLES